MPAPPLLQYFKEYSRGKRGGNRYTQPPSNHYDTQMENSQREHVIHKDAEIINPSQSLVYEIQCNGLLPL
jgi:hypothetical protein